MEAEILLLVFSSMNAGVAQMAEQGTCNPQIGGSMPLASLDDIAKWLGRGLQTLTPRFESECRLMRA